MFIGCVYFLFRWREPDWLIAVVPDFKAQSEEVVKEVRQPDRQRIAGRQVSADQERLMVKARQAAIDKEAGESERFPCRPQLV